MIVRIFGGYLSDSIIQDDDYIKGVSDKMVEIGKFAPDQCNGCGKKITEAVQNYSIDKFKVPLCMECQKKADFKK